MPTVDLTDRFIDTLPAPVGRVEFLDARSRNLALRVTQSGQKTWTLRYRNSAGELRRLTLGNYPDVSLKAARKRAEIVRGSVASGEDPAQAKQDARRQQQTSGDTVADLAAEYIERHAKVFKRSWKEDQRMLNADVLPVWKGRKVAELTRRDVRELVTAIARRGAPIAANRCLALVQKLLNFAIDQEWPGIETSPAARMTKPGAEQAREEVLSDDSIRRVWLACETERPLMCALLRLRLVTAQRGGELAHLRWEDVDVTARWITLPGTSTKNRRPHRVPLSPMALDLLTALPRTSDEWVFPGRSDTQPLTDEKRAGQRVGQQVLAELRKADPTITAFDFRGHDLRRTASTRMAEAGIPGTDISRVLNHAQGGPKATHIYNRYDYDREKRVALETWARVLTGILAHAPAATVIPFARA